MWPHSLMSFPFALSFPDRESVAVNFQCRLLAGQLGDALVAAQAV
jgi:hypothetical protein